MSTQSALGTGAAISFVFDPPFQNESFVAHYRQIGNVGGAEVPVLDDTSLATEDVMEKKPGDLADYGDIECEIFARPGQAIPLKKKGVYTISLPPEEGKTNPGTFAASGFISSTTGADLRPNEQQIESYRLTIDGKKTKPTYTAST